MNLDRDFREFVELFSASGVRYSVVGGYAMAAHGFPRSTGDLHSWIVDHPENAGRVLRGLDAFGVRDIQWRAGATSPATEGVRTKV